MINSGSIWINSAAFQLMNAIASPLLNSIMVALSESFYVVLPLLVIYFLIKKDKDVFALVVAILLLFALGYGLKEVFMQPRPCSVTSLSWINAPICETGYSFPSDHAVVLTGLLFFVWKYRKTRALYAVWLALELFGRVYLGQHYLTDVAAGVAVSLVIAYAIYRLREPIHRFASKTIGLERIFHF